MERSVLGSCPACQVEVTQEHREDGAGDWEVIINGLLLLPAQAELNNWG